MSRLTIRRSTLAAAVFAAVCLALAAVTGAFPVPDEPSPRLARAGATVGLIALIVVVLLLIGGTVMIIIGRRRARREDDEV